MPDSPTSSNTAAVPAPAAGPVRNRKDYVATCELSPETLVGSWFHLLEDEIIVYQGIVVAEPQPGMYLLQLDNLEGARNVQRLVGLERMCDDEGTTEYRFYDTEEQARNAFAEWTLQHEREIA